MQVLVRHCSIRQFLVDQRETEVTWRDTESSRWRSCHNSLDLIARLSVRCYVVLTLVSALSKFRLMHSASAGSRDRNHGVVKLPASQSSLSAVRTREAPHPFGPPLSLPLRQLSLHPSTSVLLRLLAFRSGASGETNR